MNSSPPAPLNRKQVITRAFIVGAVLHAVLLGLSLSEVFQPATLLLFLFAFPGLIVDMSSEIVHPSQTGGYLLAILGTTVNGAAYALVAWVIMIVTKRR
jgi:hypothetical protein